MKTYSFFLKNRQALDKALGISATEREFLEAVAIRHNDKAPLTVTEIMAMSNMASPATQHRRMEILINKGLIEAEVRAGDRRTKFLKPSRKALSYFNKVDGLIKTW